MQNLDTVLQHLESQKTRLQEVYHLTQIGVFGSVATHKNHALSDLDILVEFEENTPSLFELKQRLKAELQDAFNCSVDLCRKKYIKPFMKADILKEVVYV